VGPRDARDPDAAAEGARGSGRRLLGTVAGLSPQQILSGKRALQDELQTRP
jgi:hypothetical protein